MRTEATLPKPVQPTEGRHPQRVEQGAPSTLTYVTPTFGGQLQVSMPLLDVQKAEPIGSRAATAQPGGADPPTGPHWRPDLSDPPSWSHSVKIASGAIAGAMCAISMNSLMPGSGGERAIKIILMGSAAWLTYTTLIHVACEKWAQHAAEGYRSCFYGPLFAITLFGAALTANAGTGLLKDDVTKLIFSEHGQKIATAFAGSARAETNKAAIVSTLQLFKAWAQKQADCERKGCYSGSHGDGAIHRALLAHVETTDELLAQFDKGSKARAAGVKAGEAHTAAYRKRLAAWDGVATTRGDLQAIDARARDSLANLEVSTPTVTLRVFLGSLERGISSSKYPDGAARYTADVKAQAQLIRDVLGEPSPTGTALDEFPPEIGTPEILPYLPRFWPQVAFLAGLEILLPLGLFWGAYQHWVRVIEEKTGMRRRRWRLFGSDDNNKGTRP